MNRLAPSCISSITDIVGEDRIRTDHRECMMYSFDIGVMPPLVRPLLDAGEPDAVVRPEDEAVLASLMRYAHSERIALVPRSMATSGYGGVLPQEHAVVVDLMGWNRILDIDSVAMTVTTQGAAVWEQIDREIAKQGLALRLYPSSYPASSVAGWLAQGGSGFGSFEFGSFAENVVSARVLLPNGTPRVFSGEDLQTYIADAEGITGFITEVTFRVRELEEEKHRLISCPDIGSLQVFLDQIRGMGLPIWSVTGLNPTSVRLKKRLPHRHMHEWEKEHVITEPEMPEEYLVLLAYPASRESLIEAGLTVAIAQAGATQLDHEAAEHEWSQRFAPMRLKRTGPSIIPTEVIVPRAKLSAVLVEIERSIDHDFVLELMLDSHDEVVLLGYIPHNERVFGFNVAFALALSVIAIARRHGGRGFSTGLYFRHEAEHILGGEKVGALRAFKREHDPEDLLNPGKVIGRPGAIGALMKMATAMDGLIRAFANMAKPPARFEEGLPTDMRGVPNEVAFASFACARCGYCVPTCEQFTGRGWESQSPRGKYFWLREIASGREKFDQDAVDTFLVCTTCEVCNHRCQLDLPVEHNWMQLRGELVHEKGWGTFPPFEMMGAALDGEGDIWAGKREHRTDWIPEDMKDRFTEKSEYLYFPGCTASYVEHDVAEASARVLMDAGYDISYMGTDENCCGIPMKMAGKWGLFEEIYRRNTRTAREMGAKYIITSCPACALTWKDLYRDIAERNGESYEFEVKHYSELVSEALVDGRLDPEKLQEVPELGRVTFHDSCHAGRAQGIYEQPRAMLDAIPSLERCEMEHNRQEGYCCGSVLTLVGEMEVAPVLGKKRLDEAVDVQADTVVAMCPCCQVQLRDSIEKNDLPVRVEDLARVFALSMGYDIPSSDTESLKQWGYFEKFIPLMRPENMTKVMTEVFPQMLEAMPAGMGKMMVPMAKTAAGRAMISRMMPILFPKMAPGILAHVMPDLVTVIRRTVGEIPDDMNELLPDLLPRTMEAMLTSYLPELMPHVVPAFVDHLAEEAKVKHTA